MMLAEIVSIPGFYEPFSSLTHLLGAVLFAILSALLLYRGRGDQARLLSLLIFSVSGVLLLATSGWYHLLNHYGGTRDVVQKMDHAAIFVLIASTFTPIHYILFRGWGRWGMLAVIWSIASLGILLKLIYFDQLSPTLSLLLYLGMGWLGLYSGISLWRRHGLPFIQPIFWGGVVYSLGALVGSQTWLTVVPGVVQGHELFHLAVLVGLALHWTFIYHIADGHLAARTSARYVGCEM